MALDHQSNAALLWQRSKMTPLCTSVLVLIAAGISAVCVSGCGGYADNKTGAVSPTGHGEAIMKVTLSRLILFHMEQGTSSIV